MFPRTWFSDIAPPATTCAISEKTTLATLWTEKEHSFTCPAAAGRLRRGLGAAVAPAASTPAQRFWGPCQALRAAQRINLSLLTVTAPHSTKGINRSDHPYEYAF